MSELFPPDHPAPEPELLRRLQLSLVPGIGPRLQRRLLECFGSCERVLSASLAELEQVDGIGAKLARQIQVARDPSEAEQEWQRCCERNVSLLAHGQPGYPRNLESVDDSPLLLYARGSVLPQDDLAVAIVGSRRCTVYGTQQAEKLARVLATAGITIISGLARGIDAAAHQGALAAGGRTIAVSATGVLNIYPPEHRELAERITASGAIVSESKLEQHPSAGLFPQRNRIISGMSLGVIIVEANRASGALHTARHAMQQGREVMAVPGHIDSLASEGCHDLIRDGATLIRHADDVLECLGPLVKPIRTPQMAEVRSVRELTLNDQERAVLNLLTTEPRAVDEVLRSSALDSSRVLATLTVLELRRLVRRLPGGMVMRVPW